jgi:hypothetical protein
MARAPSSVRTARDFFDCAHLDRISLFDKISKSLDKVLSGGLYTGAMNGNCKKAVEDRR